VSITQQYAYSYGWWKYWTVDNGISIFNNTYYSQSTCKHQREALALIREPDLILYHTTANLTRPDEALKEDRQAKVKTKYQRTTKSRDRSTKDS
jgi:hypothetical protein